MEYHSTVNMQLDAASPWAARLNGSCQPTSTTPDSLDVAVTVVSHALQGPESNSAWLLTASLSDFWAGIESFLWNELLPLQTSFGTFEPLKPPSHPDSCMDALVHCLGNAVTLDGAGLRINLPVSSTGSLSSREGPVSWVMETAYPQEGSFAFTFFTECDFNIPLLIRPPGTGSAGGQLLRNGSTCAMVFEEGYLRLDGPWRNGDHVEFRFGVPFSVRSPGQKPVERGYPGAPPISNATVWHGCRELIPLPAISSAAGQADSGKNEPRPLSVGVRKDGVLILRADTANHGSPFEALGDCFLTKDQPPRKLIAKALLGSLTEISEEVAGAEVTFTAFETSFDRGA